MRDWGLIPGLTTPSVTLDVPTVPPDVQDILNKSICQMYKCNYIKKNLMHCTVKMIRLCFKSCCEGVLPVSCQFNVLIYVSFVI